MLDERISWRADIIEARLQSNTQQEKSVIPLSGAALVAINNNPNQ